MPRYPYWGISLFAEIRRWQYNSAFSIVQDNRRCVSRTVLPDSSQCQVRMSVYPCLHQLYELFWTGDFMAQFVIPADVHSLCHGAGQHILVDEQEVEVFCINTIFCNKIELKTSKLMVICYKKCSFASKICKSICERKSARVKMVI